MAACESLLLQKHLKGRRLPDPAAFFRDAGKVVDIPWQLAVGGDLAIDSVTGRRPLPLRIVNAYVARILRAAPRDAVVSAAFQHVVHMVKHPSSLFAPGVMWRVLCKGGQARVMARSAEPAPVQA